MPPKVLIQNLNIYYRQKQALYDVNMEISEKQILAVFGPSNSGVTSLLRSLNRLCDLNPESRIEGRILLDG
ncbi:MAG: phosphate ABC transporter ATP-binding protein, partial [Clostridia bacterium]|nr:phosphate ABC transporter ATP-binding protein [Clostridia bacterium]